MNPTLLSKLRHLRLSGMAEALPGRLTQATAASLPGVLSNRIIPFRNSRASAAFFSTAALI